MNSMKSTFLEETNELLGKLETSLLLLESSPDDEELIEEIFRSMHTIKGSSSMFGYVKIASFVHNLESIYDQIRSGKLAITKALLDVTLGSLDHLRLVIIDTEVNHEINKQNHKSLTTNILSLFNEDVDPTDDIQEDVEVNELIKKETTYYILFKPNINILKNGTNPFYILDDLSVFGQTEIFSRFAKIDNIEGFEATNNYAYWEIFISTAVNKNELLDVFLFVESDSEIKVEEICNYNLLAAKESKAYIQELSQLNTNDLIELEVLKKHVKKSIQYTVDPIVEKKALLENPLESNVQEKGVSSIRVDSDKLDTLMSIVSELVTTQAGLSLHSENNFNPELEVISENVEKLSRQLRDVAFGMTLIPIKTIMSRFQRLVRDVSSDLGKTVNFKIEGDETELDKNIIESLTDPLMHILRNSLDHGIESTEERLKQGKEKEGNIILRAFYSGASVHIQIKDDGKGIDVNTIQQKAIDKGLITNEALLSEKEILELIFSPGFSTANSVTDVSGRGVGMDVVKRNIENIRGEIEIKSIVNQGTVLTIKLPLTLSIIDGLLVEIGDVNYIIQLSVVEKCHEVAYKELASTLNQLLVLDDIQIPFLNLREEFLVKTENPSETQVIVVNNGDRKVGITVDSIIGVSQAVLKPIGQYYKNQDYISGTTILGDGTVALVLDTNKMINQFNN
tara:strand:- start:10204 stop:12246 length:2043 start_codon:yes stop_codon:yes gene_type:complete